MHSRGYQPGAVEVQTVLLLLYGLKSSRLCSLPWQQCGSRRQPREGSSTYACHTCLSSTYCIMRTAVSVVKLLLVGLPLVELLLIRVVPEGSWRHFSASEYKSRRIRYVVTTFWYGCVSGTSTAKASTSSYEQHAFEYSTLCQLI